MFPLRSKFYPLYLVLFLLSVSPLVSRIFEQKEKKPSVGELFSENVQHLNSIEKLVDYTDSIYYSRNDKMADTGQYVSVMSDLMRNRFYLSPLNYTFSENWIAYVCGKIFWSHFSSIVIADDIIKHPNGLCSQQTIVFMNALRKKNISVRSVGLGYEEGPGHFLCEVKYNGTWHLHDVSVEPSWSKISNHHLSMNYYMSKKDSLFIVYQAKLQKDHFFKLMEKVQYGEENELPAFNMTLFHRITFVLIYLLPCVFFLLFLMSFKRKHRETIIEPQKKMHQLQDGLKMNV